MHVAAGEAVRIRGNGFAETGPEYRGRYRCGSSMSWSQDRETVFQLRRASRGFEKADPIPLWM